MIVPTPAALTEIGSATLPATRSSFASTREETTRPGDCEGPGSGSAPGVNRGSGTMRCGCEKPSGPVSDRPASGSISSSLNCPFPPARPIGPAALSPPSAAPAAGATACSPVAMMSSSGSVRLPIVTRAGSPSGVAPDSSTSAPFACVTRTELPLRR